jgi:hypothetical protein
METPPLIPARMLNEHVYCRRLAYLEWVDARFTDNQETVEGRFAHRRVDRPEERRRRPATTMAKSALRALRSGWPRRSWG